MKKIVFPLCFMALSWVQPLSATLPTDNPITLFAAGKEMFEQRNFNGCLDRLGELRTRLIGRMDEQTATTSWAEQVDTQNAYASIVSLEEVDYMIAVSVYEKDKSSALALLQAFEEDYPVSRYLDEIRFLKGSRYFYDGNYAQAIATFDEIAMDRVPAHYQDDYFQRLGVSLLQEKEIDKAYPLFKVLSEMDSPYHTSSLYYLGYIAYAEGDYDTALRYFDQVPATGEYAYTIPYYRAQIDFIQGRRDQALKQALTLLQQILTQEQAAEMHRIAAITLYDQGQADRALVHFRQYFKTTDQPLRTAAYVAGLCAYTMGDLELAQEAFSHVTQEEDAMMQRAYLYLGQVYLQQGDMRNAQMAYERAAALDFDAQAKEEALFNYGLTLYKGSYSPFNESVTVFESFLNTYPESAFSDRVNDLLVESYMTTRNYEAALASINKIKNPGRKLMEAKQRLLFQLATQYVANGDLKQAESQLNAAIALGNYNQEVLAQAYFWRGECLYRRDQYAASAKDFSRFLQLTRQPQAPINALGYYNLAYAQFKQQLFADAIKSFEQYLRNESDKGKPTYADALNRLGDTYFYMRQFERAKQYYAQAAKQTGGTADYAVYQEAFMAGLQKNYQEKINLLQSLQQKWPQSEYIDDALFEQGQTYVTIDQPQQAIASFKRVIEAFPNGALARKAGLQLGLLYFNNNQPDAAIAAYKEVIAKYPSSGEARIAADDLKAVYVELNDIPAYASYIQSLNGKVRFEAAEQDSLTYLAAERQLMKGQSAQSIAVLQNYLQSFDNGAFKLNALTELGRIYYADKAFDQAKVMYERVLQQPHTPFTEEALARTAAIYFDEQDFAQALARYKQLDQMAEQKDNKRAAQIGVLRSAVALQDQKETVLAATALLQQVALAPDLQAEATYARAKALIAMGDQKGASQDLAILAKDMRNAYGAEAAYLLAQRHYDEQQLDQAEAQVLKLIDSATSHQYWLARGFILLTDVYIARNDSFQAKQYLESLNNNYTGNDDIKSLIDARFQQLEKLNNEK